MNRRGFLGAILAAAAAPAFIRSGILMPVRAVSIPTAEEVISVVAGNQLLTIEMITREALRVLHKNMAFVASTNRAFDHAFGDKITIRVPASYERR